jgi:hypothetical protein
MAWKPHMGFQTAALDAKLFVDELFMGGDRGGGKTGTLLADFALDVNLGAKWKGVMFRKTTDEFETLIERSKEMYLNMFSGAKFLEDDMLWKFPTGATLQFFHMFRDSDVDRFVGQERTWIGWDELPQFANPKPYLRMLASVRTSGKNIPMRVRGTGNPGGAGIGWIKQRFQIDDKDPKGSSGKLIIDPRTGLTRMFLLSLYKENKTHQQQDPNYRKRLLAATEGDPELERAWIHADFSALFGAYFKLFDDEIHKADPLQVLEKHGGTFPPYWRLEAGLDYGESAPTVFQLWITSPEDVSYLIAEYYDVGEYPSEHAAACEDLYRSCPYTKGRKPARVWADSQIFYTNIAAQRASLNKKVSDVFRREAGLNVVPSNKDRKAGWRHMKELLAWKKNEQGVFTRTPSLYYFPECVNFEREIKDAVHSETGDREDIDKGCSDHAIDCARYWSMGARKGAAPQKEKPVGAVTFSDHLRVAALRRRGVYVDAGVPMTQPEQMRHAVA